MICPKTVHFPLLSVRPRSALDFALNRSILIFVSPWDLITVSFRINQYCVHTVAVITTILHDNVMLEKIAKTIYKMWLMFSNHIEHGLNMYGQRSTGPPPRTGALRSLANNDKNKVAIAESPRELLKFKASKVDSPHPRINKKTKINKKPQ